MSDFNLNELHIDILKELGNIGAGNATTALSQFLGKSIKMTVPEVNILPFEEVPEVVGGPEELVAGVYMRIEGEAPGSLMLLLKQEDALKLIDVLLGRDSSQEKVGTADLDDIEQSALMETGNIVANSYLNSLADMTKMEVGPSVPAISVDMAGAILEVILFQVDEEISEHVILIGTEFAYEGNTIRGHFFLIPDNESFPKIIKSLGFDYDDS
ncbi:chemotaxis protein CheC [Natranaerobius thermophilus]|uniref:CheC, inhibitor of MCP methylation n=1 Tax=Natranaerobius thermophilus (strain ATCC BAA-1301 / DSM 18059 / JW/NM-WN-LF) TaxID=457570 RepID=B2A373_NATTJ|nr:chemotaxis protein CheC [Natranaerobius thermophilus]ACB85003.1 CheC, inhibitor of MCP methylation [Natranaerobius thermophilus JW/NM-WN-LF]